MQSSASRGNDLKGGGVPLPCKPDSVHPLRGWTAISLTPPRRSALLAQDATNTRGYAGGPPFPCSVLHHARFAVPSGYPDSRWALTPPFHPCLWPCGPSAVSFCCTVCPGSSRYPSLTFMRRVALWCPDFPQPLLAETLRPSGERRAETVPQRLIVQSKTAPDSEITGSQSRVLGDSRQHPRPDFLAVVKCERKIRVSGPLQYLM
jgi:hypothetical protein